MRNYESYREPEIAIWQNEVGEWFACLHGVENGNAWESDDLGPFGSAEEAREAGEEYLAAPPQ